MPFSSYGLLSQDVIYLNVVEFKDSPVGQEIRYLLSRVVADVAKIGAVGTVRAEKDFAVWLKNAPHVRESLLRDLKGDTS
jgi:hypothetical protein